MLRDTQEMGRDLDQVLNQYVNFVKPAFEEFTLPVLYKGNQHVHNIIAVVSM